MNAELQARRFKDNRWFWYNRYTTKTTRAFQTRQEAYHHKPTGHKIGWLLCKVNLKTEQITQYNGRPLPK